MGLELPRELGCSPGSAAAQRRPLTQQGLRAERELGKSEDSSLSTAMSPSERGEGTGRNKAEAQAWVRL